MFITYTSSDKCFTHTVWKLYNYNVATQSVNTVGNLSIYTRYLLMIIIVQNDRDSQNDVSL